MKFLFIEPFYGGSHRDFADGLAACSEHDIDLRTLPARFWKWRMRGAALHLVHKITRLSNYDGLVLSNMMSLCDFKALCKEPCPPTLVYFHENQLAYPVAPGEIMDVQFGFTDITTALAADRLLFNSRAHMAAFLAALPPFLNMMPDHRPKWVIGRIRDKADVCYPGCQFGSAPIPVPQSPQTPPLIIWNHRWEHDKNPEAFFVALAAVQERGLDFRVAILGEQYPNRPPIFDTAKKQLGDRIVHFGYVESKAEYLDWLKRGDIVISTALQENFGIAVIEAVRSGCLPLLPHRLSYPEIIPARFHDRCLYQSPEDLCDKLAAAILHPGETMGIRSALSEAMSAFSWESRIDDFDRELRTLAGTNR